MLLSNEVLKSNECKIISKKTYLVKTIKDLFGIIGVSWCIYYLASMSLLTY